MSPQEVAMMRMQMQQQGMMRPGEPGMNMRPNMMPNGGNMEMMSGPNGMMMRPNGPGGNMVPMPGNGQMGNMMPGPGGGMIPSGMMQSGMMGQPGHPAMQQAMGNRPPPPEYGMSSQVVAI